VHLFGLTGGIASGKSAVAAVFRDAGLPVLDADTFARDVVRAGTPALEAIAARFGARVLTAAGELDRKIVADIVFASRDDREALNRIVHPKIGERTAEEAAKLASAGAPLACYEAALLVENGLADAFRPLVVVASSPDAQSRRLSARDGFNDTDARRRLAAQAPMEDKLRVADIVIANDGSLDELRARARVALTDVCTRLAVDPARYGL